MARKLNHERDNRDNASAGAMRHTDEDAKAEAKAAGVLTFLESLNRLENLVKDAADGKLRRRTNPRRSGGRR